MDKKPIAGHHRDLFFETIQKLRRDERYCDFTIIADGKEFKTNKLVLAASSLYFRCMIEHNTREARENRAILQNVTAKAMEFILNFWYGTEMLLNDENVHEILIASQMIQAQEVVEYCEAYLEQKIDINNCLDYYTTASGFRIEKLYNVSLDFCLDNFEILMDMDEFLELEKDHLAALLSDDKLNVDSEEIVFKAIIKWIMHDETNRLEDIASLMSNVRFNLLDITCVKDWIADDRFEMLLKSHECSNLLLKSVLGLSCQHLPRTPLRKQQRIYAIGGWPNGFKPTQTAERYDRYSDAWVEIDSMKKPRCGVGIAILNNSIYAIGGHDGQEYLKDVERYDLTTDSWHNDVADMGCGRNSLGAATLDGYIYAMGGQLGTSCLNHVERYDPQTNTWTPWYPMLKSRLGLGVAVLSRKIFACGGASDDSEVAKTVEYLDPETNMWTFVKPMLVERKHFGCTSYSGKIYVVGGRGTENSHELNTAECYDPMLDVWASISPMKWYRSGIGLVELDGNLYAVGGHNGDKKLGDVEIYDPRIDQWMELKNSMIHERLGAGVVVHSMLNSQ